jgi:hypothetical protein
MIGYISALSFHRNTRIVSAMPLVDQVSQPNEIDNYATVLDDKHIWPQEQFVEQNNIIYIPDFFTYRLLVHCSEEYLFDDSFPEHVRLGGVHMKTLADPLMATIFSDKININNVFNRELYPVVIRERIISAVRSIQFKSHIYDSSDDITKTLTHPSLGGNQYRSTIILYIKLLLICMYQ